jgi:hypothetical protein
VAYCAPAVGLIATAATAAATVSAAAATTTAAAAAAAAATIFARTRFVHGQRATFVLLVVEALNGRLGYTVRAHFDETKAFAPSRVSVLDDLRALHRAEFREQLFKL